MSWRRLTQECPDCGVPYDSAQPWCPQHPETKLRKRKPVVVKERGSMGDVLRDRAEEYAARAVELCDFEGRRQMGRPPGVGEQAVVSAVLALAFQVARVVEAIEGREGR